MTVLNKHVVVIRGPTASKTTLITCRKMCGLYKQVYIYTQRSVAYLLANRRLAPFACADAAASDGTWEVDVVALFVLVCVRGNVRSIDVLYCALWRLGIYQLVFLLHLSHDFV